MSVLRFFAAAVVVAVILVSVESQSVDSGNSIDTWVDALSQQLATLRTSVMRVDDVVKLFNETQYAEEALEADALADELARRLNTVFGAKERIVKSLATAVESAWRGAKDGEGSTCQYQDASKLSSGLTPNPLYFDAVSHDFSAVKLAPDANVETRYICVTEALDAVFKANDPDRNLPWQYVGINKGYHRQYPASLRTGTYDARSRPWYTGASSGPKDVVLVLDISGSMAEFDRISLMKDAAKTVLASLTINDYVNVVVFSSGAQTPARSRTCSARSTVCAPPARPTSTRRSTWRSRRSTAPSAPAAARAATRTASFCS
jgi:hypothetical protein